MALTTCGMRTFVIASADARCCRFGLFCPRLLNTLFQTAEHAVLHDEVSWLLEPVEDQFADQRRRTHL